jgi:hypothetical protein
MQRGSIRYTERDRSHVEFVSRYALPRAGSLCTLYNKETALLICTFSGIIQLVLSIQVQRGFVNTMVTSKLHRGYMHTSTTPHPEAFFWLSNTPK